MMHLSPEERKRFLGYEAMIEIVKNHAAYLAQSREDPACKELYTALEKAELCVKALTV